MCATLTCLGNTYYTWKHTASHTTLHAQGQDTVGDVAGARVSPLNLPDSVRHACGVSKLPVAQEVLGAVIPGTDNKPAVSP